MSVQRSRGAIKAATVVAALAEQGIEVPASLVYGIRKNRTKRGTPKTIRGAKTRRQDARHGLVSLEALLDAKKFVAAMGGLEQARSALAVLEKLS